MLLAFEQVPRFGGFGVALSLVLGVALLTAAVVRLLKPIDQGPAPTGKKWKLPPGPRGYPVIGNLLLYEQGEAAVS